MVLPRVLIIDDDPTIREVLAGGLREQGFRVLQAPDAVQGVEWAASKKPDVVLLDVMMPGMDGFEICRALKESPSTAMTPLVFLTARAASADIERGLLLGADDYITKPFDIYQLGDRLMTLVRHHMAITPRKMGITLRRPGRKSRTPKNDPPS